VEDEETSPLLLLESIDFFLALRVEGESDIFNYWLSIRDRDWVER